MRMLKKKSWFAKATALLLSMVLVLSTFISAFAAEEQKPYSVVVTDKSTGAVIAGANISITLPEGIVIAGLDGIVTNDEGKAEIQAITDYFVTNPGVAPLDITCKVTADNYSANEVTTTVTTGEESLAVELTDTVAPVIEGVEGIPTDWIQGKVVLKVKASDDATMYKVDGGEWQNSATFEVSSNGDYTFYAKDVYDNTSEQTVTVSYVDNEIPSITGVTINPNAWTNESVKVTVEASDSLSGVLEYQMDSEGWQSSAEFEVADYKEHNFFVKDKVGNVSVAYTVKVQFDNKKPEITETKPTIDGGDPEVVVTGATNQNVKVTVTGKDVEAATDGSYGKSDVAGYACVVDGDTLIQWQTSNEFVITDARTYVIYIKDAAGNISEVKTVQYDIDKTVPTIVGVAPTANEVGYTNKDVEITVSADDASPEGSNYISSGISAYACVLSGTEVTNDDWKTTNTFVITDAREYSIYVKDVAGNVSAEKSVQYDIDKDATAITGVNPTTDEVGYANTDVEITVSADDASPEGSNYISSGISAYACVLSGAEITDSDWKTINTFVITDAREYSVYVKDVAGNISETKVQYDIDKDLPKITDVTPTTDEVGYVNEDVEITVSANDASLEGSNYISSGISAYACVLSGSEVTDSDWKTTNTFIITDAREYAIYVKDAAGNISETVNVQFNIDKCAPTYEGVEYLCVNDGAFASVLNKVLFGLFFKTVDRFIITAEDIEVSAENLDIYVESGIAGYKFIVNDVNGQLFGEWDYKVAEDNAEADIKANEFKFSNLPENFKGTMQVVIYDNAGNASVSHLIQFALDDGSNLSEFVVENDAPEISGILPNDKTILRDDFTYAFNVADEFEGKEWASGIAAVKVTVNGTEFVLEDNVEEIILNKDYSLDVTIDPHKVLIGENEIKWNNGVLEFVIEVCDNSGNYDSVESVIYIDQTAPIIDGFTFDLTDNIDVDDKKGVYEAVKETDYGFYFKKDVNVTISAEDVTGEAVSETEASGVQSITYKVVAADGTVVAEGTEEVTEYTITLEEGFKGQIHAYATDKLGNHPLDCVNFTEKDVDEDNDGYVHPNGIIIENQDSHDKADEDHVALEIPETTYTQNNGKPLYANDVNVKLTVKDSFAGIREVEWSVEAGYDTGNNYQGSLTINNAGEIEYSDATSKEMDWVKDATDKNLVTSITNTIKVSNNSNDIVVTVTMTDRSGNTTTDKVVFGIDKTNPQITLEYDNNEPDEEYTDIYDANRTATITIQERNFRAEDVVIVIENTDGAIPKVSAWVTTADASDPDKTVHKAVIKYTKDGDYTFKIDYKDNAMNAAKQVKDKFTIDKTLPEVTVEYDNNSAQNGNYYKAERTATITIKEHNFDQKRVTIIGSADEGSFPKESAWKESEKDTYVATIHYEHDALYKFDIEIEDKAGNSIEDFKQEKFTVDKTNPVVAISGIVDKSANNDDGNIGYVISATDKNFDVFAPVLTAVLMKDGEFVTKTLTLGELSAITKGQQYTVENIEDDGIYSITCTVVDKAGNEYSEVILENADGKTYTKKRFGADKLVTFSVNRFGSTFELGSYTTELVETYYVQNVTEDVTITEINADELTEKTVTINGNALVENEDYTVALENNSGTWYRYTYSFDKTLFDDEGEYNIVIATSDKATNEAFSDVKDATVKFVVDRTAPALSIVGMKNNGRYQTNNQVVTLAPTDDGGWIKSLLVCTVDKNGDVLDTLIELSGDELDEALATGQITFELKEGLYQNVKIICEDYAGNITGSESGELYENISVSTNAFMIHFWTNKPLRWGTIAGLCLLIAAAIILIVSKKRKRDEK